MLPIFQQLGTRVGVDLLYFHLEALYKLMKNPVDRFLPKIFHRFSMDPDPQNSYINIYIPKICRISRIGFKSKGVFFGGSCVLTKGPTSKPKLGWWNGSSPLSTELLADLIVHVHGSSGDWCMQLESLSPHPLFEIQGVVVMMGMRVMVQLMKVPMMMIMMMMLMEVQWQLLNLKMRMMNMDLMQSLQRALAWNPIMIWKNPMVPTVPKPKSVLQIQAVWRVMPQVLAACVAPGLFWLVPGKERKHLHLQHHPVETQIDLFDHFCFDILKVLDVAKILSTRFGYWFFSTGTFHVVRTWLRLHPISSSSQKCLCCSHYSRSLFGGSVRPIYIYVFLGIGSIYLMCSKWPSLYPLWMLKAIPFKA